MSGMGEGAAAWFPDGHHGYSIALCRCSGGPHLGARKMGTPCRCEGCGFMTQDQWNYLRSEVVRAMAVDLAAHEDADLEIALGGIDWVRTWLGDRAADLTAGGDSDA